MKDPIVQLILGDGQASFVVQILVRIILACIIAGFLGIERANKRHAAGLRTFIVVSLAATIGAIIDYYLISVYGVAFPAVSLGTVIGLAFISSYTILYSSRSQIKGLTTAAALWGQAFIGLSVGFGLYTITLASVIVLLVSLSKLTKLEVYLKNRSTHFEILVEFKNKTDLPSFINVIRELGLTVDNIENNPAYVNTGLSVYSISLSITSKELKKYKTHKDIIEALRSSLPYVSHIEEMR